MGLQGNSILRRMSETPTTSASQKSIAIHIQFVLQYASNLNRSAFGAPELQGKGNTFGDPPICIAVRLPFVLQSSLWYRSTVRVKTMPSQQKLFRN